MIEVNIDVEGVKMNYQVPSSWDEVTVEQFTKLYRVKSPNTNELLGAVTMISALSGIEEGIILQMDIDDFRELSTKLLFITKEVPREDTEFVEINGEEYFLYTDFNRLTTGEVITLETILESAEYDVHKIMPDLLCLFLRKKDKEGKLEKFTTDMLKRKEIFLSIPITKIYHLFSFFLIGGNTSANNTKDSTRNEDQLMTPKEDSQRN